MTRRVFYQLAEAMRIAVSRSISNGDDDLITRAVLDAVADAMAVRRGQAHSVREADSVLAPLLAGDGVGVLLEQDDALGQIYQALNAPMLELAYRASSGQRRKFTPAEIPAVSQLFTPRWVVEFLLHNTLGRLWVQWHPTTRLRARLHWLCSDDEPAAQDSPRARRAVDIRVLDPSCGTMNFGLVAYELLYEMYAEEIDRAAETGWNTAPSVATGDEIPCSILRHNLFGVDIDPLALQLSRAALRMKSGVDLPDAQWNLWLGDSLFDEHIAEKCASGFDVVATNPPYVSSRNLAVPMVAKMKKRFPASWRDLYACFIERSLDFTRDGGRVGLLVMQSFMFTGAYQKLRKRICDSGAVESIAHFGPRLFDIGNPGTLQTAALVVRKESCPNRRAVQSLIAFRLTDIPGEQKRDTLQNEIRSGAAPSSVCFRRPQSALLDLPRQSWAYWVDGSLRHAFTLFPRLAEISPPRQGLATTDNARFVRYWWEVEPTHAQAAARATPGKWFAYVKSGQFRRWYESPRHRVNWLDDGREIKQAIVDRYPYLNGEWRWVAKNSDFYGRGGVAWSYLTSGRFSARRLEPGAIFDVAGSSLFPADVPGMLALLNSSAVHRLLQAINPTVNFQVGDLAELPVPEKIPGELGAMAESAISLQQRFDAGDETAPDFSAPRRWDDAIEQSHQHCLNLQKLEQEIDAGVCALYRMEADPSAPAPPAQTNRVELARRWISHAVGLLLGRWGGGPPNCMLQLNPPDPRVVSAIRDILAARAGDRAVGEIDAAVGGIGAFLAGEFYSWHVRLYRYRPPYWGFRSRGRVLIAAHDTLTREMLQPIIRGAGVKLPRQWKRNVDEGIGAGLLPFAGVIADAGLKNSVEKLRLKMSDRSPG